MYFPTDDYQEAVNIYNRKVNELYEMVKNKKNKISITRRKRMAYVLTESWVRWAIEHGPEDDIEHVAYDYMPPSYATQKLASILIMDL